MGKLQHAIDICCHYPSPFVHDTMSCSSKFQQQLGLDCEQNSNSTVNISSCHASFLFETSTRNALPLVFDSTVTKKMTFTTHLMWCILLLFLLFHQLIMVSTMSLVISINHIFCMSPLSVFFSITMDLILDLQNFIFPSIFLFPRFQFLTLNLYWKIWIIAPAETPLLMPSRSPTLLHWNHSTSTPATSKEHPLSTQSLHC